MKLLTKNSAVLLALTLLVLVAGSIVLGLAQMSYGGMTENKASDTERYKDYSFFSATTTNATSTDVLDLKGADRVQLYFTRNGAAASVATSTFSVQVSPNGTDWYDYNKLISNVTNTNSQDVTRVASVQIVGATSTTMVALDLSNDVFEKVRCIASNASTTLEADDSNTCTAGAQY